MVILWIYGGALVGSIAVAFAMDKFGSAMESLRVGSPVPQATEAETLVREIAEVEATNAPDFIQSRAREMVRKWDAATDKRSHA